MYPCCNLFFASPRAVKNKMYQKSQSKVLKKFSIQNPSPPKKIGAVRLIKFLFGLRPAHTARPTTSSRLVRAGFCRFSRNGIVFSILVLGCFSGWFLGGRLREPPCPWPIQGAWSIYGPLAQDEEAAMWRLSGNFFVGGPLSMAHPRCMVDVWSMAHLLSMVQDEDATMWG